MFSRHTALPLIVSVVLGGLAGHAADPPLVAAIKRGDDAAIQSLVKARSGINDRLADGATPLHWAAHLNRDATLVLLMEAGADVNAANDYGIVPLALACTNGNPATVGRLLDGRADPNAKSLSGETVLMTCARSGSAEATRLLLAKGADVNAREPERGQTALMWAVAQKHADVASVLVEHGADIRARSKNGFTPLLYAARVGDVESARVLLRAGVGVNDAIELGEAEAVADRYGSEAPPQPSPQAASPKNTVTALVMAAASGHERLGIFLLENGADPNAKDQYGATALHYAMLKGMASMNGVSLANYVSHLFRPNMTELVKALLSKGADPNLRLEKGVPVAGGRGGESAGATAFLLAAASGDPYIMRLLAEAGANPLLATNANTTPLLAAAGVGRVQDFTDAEERDALEAVRLALDLGADIDAANEKGRTALHGATVLGGDSIVEFLASRGANLDARDKWQQTPLSIASGVHLPWTPKGEELGEVVRKETAERLLRLGATPLDTPNYFIPMDEDSDIYKMNPKRSVPTLLAP